ncbi:MAG: Gx transporter family protein [Spirochaetaceae bacterium]|jgi:heptaprenyl diphosphate synthase|nr:Gx transporter family protein [Spirochaetaceae bacterium]
MKYYAAQRNLALLGACCVFLSAVEFMFPKPLPFLRLGLANLPLLLALRLPALPFLELVLVKLAAQALVSGTLFSYTFVFSLAGTAVSASLMFVLRRIFPLRLLSCVGISAAGALGSNIIQIILARYLVLGRQALLIMPPVLASGLVSGVALGVFCERFMRASRWYAELDMDAACYKQDRLSKLPLSKKPRVKTVFRFLILLALSVLTLWMPWTSGKLILFVLSIFAAIYAKRLGSPFIMLMFFLFIVFFNLLTPYGRLLLEIGAFKLTLGALETGVSKAAAVEALLLFSRAFMPREITLPGRFGSLLAEVFARLDRLTAEKNNFKFRDGIAGLDALLLRCRDE